MDASDARLLAEKRSRLPAAELAARVEGARARTLALMADLSDEELEVPRLPIVNPLRWELGHVAFFYEAFLLRLLDGGEPLIEGGDELFDSFKVDHADRWSLELPSRAGILAYMQRVHERVIKRLGAREPDARETYLYLLAGFHEDMHAETFHYARQTLGYPAPALAAARGAGEPERSAGPWPGDVDVAGGTHLLGARGEEPFVFDNEKWAHPVEVAPFRIARAPVTNAELCEFVDDDGYRRRELWSAPGWRWRFRAEAEHPVYWKREGGTWLRREFDRFVPLAEHEPAVHVGWYEAEAFCNWAGRRLPSEAEWEMAAAGARPANTDSRLMGCADVGAFAECDSAAGCRQMLGNVWEWTASAFYPFPGYVVDYPYREYSAPWFGTRKVLKGGSWATRSGLARIGYRNFFEPERRDILAGLRTCAV